MTSVFFKKVNLLARNVVNTGLVVTRGARIKFPNDFPRVPYTVHPKVLDIGMTGSTYDTKITRKRQVQDLNLPVFGTNPVECLKWSNWRMLRDVRKRYIYSYHFPLKNNLTCLMRNNILPTTVRELANTEVNQLPRERSESRLTWRCGITSRARGKFLKFRMSRIAFRNLADYNFVSGAMRSCWGP